jgi:hypothetical protein
LERLRRTVAPPFEIPEPKDRETPPGQARPAVVTAIALYEFFRAALILLVLLSIQMDPTGYLTSRLDVQVLTYIVTRHNVSSYAIPFLMPLVAVFVLSIGLGLWFLRKWARNALMIASGTTVVLWLRHFLVVDWALGETTLKTEAGRQSVYVIIMLDALIFGCLALYPDVAKAFGEKSK